MPWLTIETDTDGTANTTGSATTTQTSTTTSEAGGRLLAKIGVPSSIAVMAGGVMLL